MPAPIEYFYSCHSAFAYLGSARLMAITAATGRPIAHRPVDLRRVVDAAGGVPIRERTRAHRAYFFRREIVRWGEHRGVAVMDRTPTHHANEIASGNCVLIAAAEAGQDVDRLAHAMLEAHWRDDVDLACRDTLKAIAEATGHDGDALLAAADSEPVRALHERYTREAVERSVFGSPTYFVDGDMFYGQDHLELVERACARAYGGA